MLASIQVIRSSGLTDNSTAAEKEKLELSENLTIGPLQCFACSKRPEFLRKLSGNVILTSIKGHKPITLLQICEK